MNNCGNAGTGITRESFRVMLSRTARTGSWHPSACGTDAWISDTLRSHDLAAAGANDMTDAWRSRGHSRGYAIMERLIGTGMVVVDVSAASVGRCRGTACVGPHAATLRKDGAIVRIGPKNRENALDRERGRDREAGWRGATRPGAHVRRVKSLDPRG